jgi:putative DNA primase/helicase
MQRILETARGCWHGILPQLGISAKLLRNRHGPCPMCGGKDRFRFDDRDGKGTWICNRCGSGDGAELVKRIKGVGFVEAAAMIEGVAGKVRPSQGKPVPRPTNRAELNRHWSVGRPIELDSVAGRYLNQRCGLETFPTCLRMFEADGMAGGRAAEIMAKVTDSVGLPVTLHRTFIPSASNGGKHEWHVDRKFMPGKLPEGVAIRLGHRYGRAWGGLGIAEGIETALSASALFGVTVWAAISAPLLKKWRPPAGVGKVIIFGDNDENFTGQEAAYALARSLVDDVEVEVKIPSIPGWDWNDVHRNNLDNR